jgi:cytochrome P450
MWRYEQALTHARAWTRSTTVRRPSRTERGGTPVQATTTQPIHDVDLTDLDLFVHGDPHAVFTRLRREAPVYWHPPGQGPQGFWCVMRHADALEVYSRPTVFSSADGISLPRFRQDRNLNAEYGGGGTSIIMQDPPEHGRKRGLINRRFTPRQVAPLESHIRDIVTDILDQVTPRGECDFVTEVAAKLPTAVICEMMGIPRKDWDFMFDVTNRLLGAQDPEYQQDKDVQETGRLASRDALLYFAPLVAERRRNPGPDLISALITGEVNGERLDDRDIFANCILLMAGGQETTRNATSAGVLAVIERPAERARLLADPSLVPTWVEESLRWASPITHVRRTATRDYELRGQRIRAGDWVVIWIASANRDEEVFPDPFRFDVGRNPNEHLAFTYGEHYCLGANLARLELRVMLEEILRRMPDVELAGPVQRLRSNFVAGIKHMPVRFTPRPPQRA